MKTRITIAALLAGLCIAGLAQAQSHSVANYSNPPNVQADSKAGTDATPGLSATSDQQDNKHPNKGVKDAAANKGKKGKSAQAAKDSAQAAGTSGSKGMVGMSTSADQPASAKRSQSATASVHLDGASKGGAEATMQAEPSARNTDTATKEAFDVSPAHDGTSGKNGNAAPRK